MVRVLSVLVVSGRKTIHSALVEPEPCIAPRHVDAKRDRRSGLRKMAFVDVRRLQLAVTDGAEDGGYRRSGARAAPRTSSHGLSGRPETIRRLIASALGLWSSMRARCRVPVLGLAVYSCVTTKFSIIQYSAAWIGSRATTRARSRLDITASDSLRAVETRATVPTSTSVTPINEYAPSVNAHAFAMSESRLIEMQRRVRSVVGGTRQRIFQFTAIDDCTRIRVLKANGEDESQSVTSVLGRYTAIEARERGPLCCLGHLRSAARRIRPPAACSHLGCPAEPSEDDSP
jgi:hypothetical protein